MDHLTSILYVSLNVWDFEDVTNDKQNVTIVPDVCIVAIQKIGACDTANLAMRMENILILTHAGGGFAFFQTNGPWPNPIISVTFTVELTIVFIFTFRNVIWIWRYQTVSWLAFKEYLFPFFHIDVTVVWTTVADYYVCNVDCVHVTTSLLCRK